MGRNAIHAATRW